MMMLADAIACTAATSCGLSSGLGIKEGVIEAIRLMTTVKTFSLPW